jgi:ATP-binding cassette subfamily B protein
MPNIRATRWWRLEERTELWAWKAGRQEDGRGSTPGHGDVRFFDVDFEYEEGKPILHDVCLYAKPGQKAWPVGGPPARASKTPSS